MCTCPVILETIVHTFIHEVARSGSVERLKELISDNPSSVKYEQQLHVYQI